MVVDSHAFAELHSFSGDNIELHTNLFGSGLFDDIDDVDSQLSPLDMDMGFLENIIAFDVFFHDPSDFVGQGAAGAIRIETFGYEIIGGDRIDQITLTYTTTPAIIPLPASIWLMISALFGLLISSKKTRIVA